MKPVTNKLTLSKSTIANLDNSQLATINGGLTSNVDLVINISSARGNSGSIAIRF